MFVWKAERQPKRGSSDQHRMIEPLARKAQTGLNIFRLKIGKLFDDLLRGKAVGEQVKYIDHPNAHASDAGAPTALLRIDCNAV